MNAYSVKAEDEKSRSHTRVASPLKDTKESSNTFIDNRPEAVNQRKMAEVANSSPRLRQLAGFQELADHRQSLGRMGAPPHQAALHSEGALPLQLRTFKAKQGPLGKKARIEIVESGKEFNAFYKTGISKLTPIPKNQLKFSEFEKHDQYPFLGGPDHKLLNLNWLVGKAKVQGVGSMLMYEFALKANQANKDLFIPRATLQGPAYYEKLGFRMVGDWLQPPINREGLSDKVQESLANLEENKIDYQRDYKESKSSDEPSQGSAEMYAESGPVLNNLRDRINQHWNIK